MNKNPKIMQFIEIITQIFALGGDQLYPHNSIDPRHYLNSAVFKHILRARVWLILGKYSYIGPF